MPADAALVAPLREVQEPELRRSVVELGMVKGAVLERGVALVALALPLGRARAVWGSRR
jgi:metal-sulfur cluster biosynthetic enzyme